MIPLFIISIIACAIAGYLIGRQTADRRLAEARRETEQARAMLEAQRIREEQLAADRKAMQAEFRNIATEVTRTEGQHLRQEQQGALDALLAPLGRDIASFRDQFVKSHADIHRYIHDLVAQTDTVSRGAEELARALRGNTKLQGNWGEAVLENLLSATGLTEGRDFLIQARTKDDEGRDLIPDVIVNLPGDRAVIVDSKVSLTAYTDLAATDDGDTERRAALLKEHVASVRRHIKELSAKNYDKVVKGSIGYVLMFIPGEAAYVAAVTADPTLTTEAYRRRVILLNPTNLLMALQLAYNLWQSEMQSRSVGEIYDSADKLYRKFCTFAGNFQKIGQSIKSLGDTYTKAEKQLTTGRGNIISQLEDWKSKGLTTTGEMPKELLEP